MALAIASVPVLTGDAAKAFESRAQQTYESYLASTSSRQEHSQQYVEGVEMVKATLAKAKF